MNTETASRKVAILPTVCSSELSSPDDEESIRR